MTNTTIAPAVETSLERQLATLSEKVAWLEAVEHVKRLQNIYGYYMDMRDVGRLSRRPTIAPIIPNYDLLGGMKL